MIRTSEFLGDTDTWKRMAPGYNALHEFRISRREGVGAVDAFLYATMALFASAAVVQSGYTLYRYLF